MFAILNLSVCAALFVGMLALQEVGWRIGEPRHHLVVEEANAIGTAGLRIDLLPAAAQPQMRNLGRSAAADLVHCRLGRERVRSDAWR